MKPLKSYINIKKNKSSIPAFDKFLNTLSEYNDDFKSLNECAKMLKKIGSCELLDITTEGIIDILKTNKYKLYLNYPESTPDSYYEENNVKILTSNGNQFIISVYSPKNRYINNINIATGWKDYDNFNIYLVPKNRDFIEMYKNLYVDKIATRYTINKEASDEDYKVCIEELKNSFEEIIK